MRRAGCLKWFGVAFAVFLVLAIVGALIGDEDGEQVQAVPTFTSTPAAVQPTATVEVQQVEADPVDDYRQAAMTQGQELSEALQSISELMQDPQLTEREWVIETGVAIARVQIAHEEIAAVAPPAEFAEFHQLYVTAFATCSAFSDTLSRSIDDRDSALLDTAVVEMQSCTDQLNQAAASIN